MIAKQVLESLRKNYTDDEIRQMLNTRMRMSKYGAGKRRKRKMKGKGIVGDAYKKVKEVYGKVRDYILPSDLSSKFKNKMTQYGQQKIKSIVVARDPVQSLVQKALNFITLGKWNEMKKKLKYDDVYHLYMILTLENGKRLRLEKNQVVQMSDYSGTPKSSIVVPVNKDVSLNEFIKKGIDKMGIKNFVRYSADELNCQNFVNSLLTANGLNSPEITKFVVQDVEKLLTPLAKDVGQVVTDIAGTVTNLTGGRMQRNIVLPTKFTTMPIERPMIGMGKVRF